MGEQQCPLLHTPKAESAGFRVQNARKSPCCLSLSLGEENIISQGAQIFLASLSNVGAYLSRLGFGGHVLLVFEKGYEGTAVALISRSFKNLQ